MGDFNCPQLNGLFAAGPCDVDDVSGDHGPGQSASIILNAMAIANLRQFNTVSNSTDRFSILDLVFGNTPNLEIKVESALSGIVKPDEYHPPLEISVNLKPVLETKTPFKLNYRKANFAGINQGLVRYNWDALRDLDVNQATAHFYSVLNNLINNLVPKAKPRKHYPAWFNFDLIKEVKIKRKHHIKYIKNSTSENYVTFKAARAKCKILIDQAYKTYLNDIQTSVETDIKKFWAYAKSNRQTNTYPTALRAGSELATD